MSWLDAVISGIFNGISSRSAGKEQNRRSRQDREHDLRTMEYEYNLADYFRRKQRGELSKAWDNWSTPGGKPYNDIGEMPRAEDYFEKKPKGK